MRQRLVEVIRGPSRPTPTQLRHRRRRAGALAVIAAVALLLGMIVGSGAGEGPDPNALRAELTKVGWYGHLRMLAGNGRRSLDFEQRAQETRAIDRALEITPFVRMGGSERKLIALTFDDGPGPITNALLDVLQRLRVPATFFVVGNQLPEHADALGRMIDLGVPIANHTVGHPNLTELSRDDQRAQIDDVAAELEGYGVPYPRLFRPPYGAQDATTLSLLGRRRTLSVLWSVDSQDYRRPGVDAIVRNVVDHAHPGAIVLLHDAGGDRSQTLAAVPRIVKELRAQGYRFVTVPRLLLESPPSADQQVPPGFNSAGAG